jgi:hypothetical protein
MKIKGIVITIVLLFSCTTTKMKTTDTNIRNLIERKWCSAHYSIKYPFIEFMPDSIVYLDPRFDTFYMYWYFVKDNKLEIIKDGKVNRSEILYISKDSLILSSLLEFDTIQIYERCESLKEHDWHGLIPATSSN